jgi:hypothetical protein
MKKNKFINVLSRDDIDIINLVKRENKVRPYSRIDFDKFLLKFCGNFIYRGNKSYSFKVYDYFLINLKISLKKNPTRIFMILIKIIMPFLILGKKTFKGRVINVPVFAKGNKRNILLTN